MPWYTDPHRYGALGHVAQPVVRRQSAPAAPLGEPERPVGVTRLISPDPHEWRTYLCDPGEHMVHILDAHDRPLSSFGGRGCGLGQLDTPSDVAIVWIDTQAQAGRAASTAVLAVADRGNHRVALFELDGAPLATIGGERTGSVGSSWPSRSGFPFFRLAPGPTLAFPSRLSWNAPWLDVSCAGRLVRVDLASAVLPEFRTWVRDESLPTLRRAFQRFARDPARAEVPSQCLLAMAERLEPAPPVAFQWRGRA